MLPINKFIYMECWLECVQDFIKIQTYDLCATVCYAKEDYLYTVPFQDVVRVYYGYTKIDLLIHCVI